MQLGNQSYDHHVVYSPGEGVAPDGVKRENGAGHVHGPVDKRVADGLHACVSVESRRDARHGTRVDLLDG